MSPTPNGSSRDKSIDQILTATLELKELYKEIKESSATQLRKQDELLQKLEHNVMEVSKLRAENQQLKSRISTIEEDLIRSEQYSRKDVMIITGLPYTEHETDAELRSQVLGMFNVILKSKRYELTMLDLIALHRNGRKMNGNRPPSITVKFVRFHEKDMFFDKAVIKARKDNFAGISFFHCLSKGMIKEQSLIKQHDAVKFCRFEGAGYFTVCLLGKNGNSDTFMNRVYSFKQFESKFKEMRL